jgi:hypothetical protein
MNTRNKTVSELEETNLMFVGPSNAGKTTAILLLYHTLIDYADELGVKAIHIIPGSPFDLHMEATNLVRYGIPPGRTAPNQKDIKIRFEVEFKGLVFTKKVNIVVADMAGTITSTLMRILPDLASKTPKEVQETLHGLGLSEEEVQYVINRVFNSKGFVLVANVMDIGPEKDPDARLAQFLTNFILFKRNRGWKEKINVALLVTHMDRYLMPTTRENFIKDRFPSTYTAIAKSGFVRNYEVFFSAIYNEYTVKSEKGEEVRFQVIPKGGVHRIDYTVDEYKRLALWMRESF